MVKLPAGNSYGLNKFLAAKSAKTSKSIPVSTDKITFCQKFVLTIFLAICGAIRPTKLTTPTEATVKIYGNSERLGQLVSKV